MYSKQLAEWVLEAGEDDEVQFADIAYFVKEDSNTEDNLIPRTVDTALELMRDKVLIPGDMVDYEFQPWTLAPAEAEQRIRDEADRISQETGRLLPGDICWFHAASFSG